jgi:L-iditol 2-dehydrogenase
LVQVTAVGLCGSDIHWLAQAGIGDATLERPLVLGHEASGVIISGPRSGTRVAIDPAIPCQRCELCGAGKANLCLALRFAGHSDTDGTLRQVMSWPERCLFPIPDALTSADAAMLEPLGVALHAIDLGKLRPGASVGVYGCGPIGLLLVQLAAFAGAGAVYATDPLPHRVEAARRRGATAFTVGDGAERAAILAASGGGVDLAIEAAGTDDALDCALETVRPGQTIVLIGIPDDDRTSFAASVARRKGLTLKLSRRMNRAYPRTIPLVASGRIDVASIVSDRFPLTAFEAAFARAARRDRLKVLVEPNPPAT